MKTFAILSAAVGVMLLLSDFVVRDQALALGAFGLLTGAAVFAILLMPRSNTPTDDTWSKIAWGKFFVAVVYASMAIACFVAMAHTPDALRLVHEIAAAL